MAPLASKSVLLINGKDTLRMLQEGKMEDGEGHLRMLWVVNCWAFQDVSTVEGS